MFKVWHSKTETLRKEAYCLVSKIFFNFLSVELHVANFGRVNTDCVHKFESPGPILFLLDCTIPIKPTRNVKNFVCFLCPNSKRMCFNRLYTGNRKCDYWPEL